MQYRPEIDGLRAVAVMAVILAHAGFGVVAGGFVGVDVFFVLSGYLIGTIIVRELETGTFTFRRFYARRARRILPALFLVLLASWVPAWFLMNHSEIIDYAPSVLASLLFVSNVYFWDLTGYFSPFSETLPLLHTWSLSIEEQYYLLFPLLAFITYRLLGMRGFFAMVALVAAASLALAEWGAANKPDVNYFFSFSRFWEILAGTICVWVERRWNMKGNDLWGMLGLGAILASIVLYDAQTPFPSFFALLPIGGTMLVLFFARAETRAALVLASRPVAAIGLISYSAYLWHQPVFAFARIGGWGPTDGWIALPLIALILGLAALSWRFVEVPFRQRRDGWFTNRAAGIGALVGLAAFAAFSVTVFKTDLSLLRYAVADRPLVKTARRDALSYMRHRTKPFLNVPFADDGRRKVFLVGDSFASDLVNMLGENNHLEGLDLSIHIISSRCANLFLEPTFDFASLALPTSCDKINRYEGASVRKRLDEADAVIIISRWQDRFVEHLPESLSRIRKVTKGEVLVFGPKNLGDGDPAPYLTTPADQRASMQVQAIAEHVDVNTKMAAMELPGFINQQTIFCGDTGERCVNVASDGTLMSVDGWHLTQSGATELGAKLLAASPELRKALAVK